MLNLDKPTTRRFTLGALGVSAVAAASLGASPLYAKDKVSSTVATRGGRKLQIFSDKLAKAPRRRDFTSVPFMADRKDLWDHEASAVLLGYDGGPRQVWEASEISAAWLNLMRESINGQVFAHDNPDFLAVAAVHGTAHHVLFNQTMWDKYDLAQIAGAKSKRNDFVVEKSGATEKDDHQDVDGFYGPANNNIVSLQKRGAVFVACHDSIHAIARGIALRESNSGLPADAVAADLTNNLVSGVVLVPSVVAYLAELQDARFTYAKGA
jgi:intracellular sulfur oxidation DsrE/DsrF family protein